MFVGWADWTGNLTTPPAEQLFEAIDPFATADRRGALAAEGVVLAQAPLHTSEQSKRGSIPARCPRTGNMAAGWVRLSNRAMILSDLNLAGRGDVTSDLDLVLAGYEVWGHETARHLQGEFALAVWDAMRSEVYLARDPLGTRPLFMSWSTQAAAFATTLAAFRGLPGIDDSPDPMWMACFIADLPGGTDGPLALRGARRLEAGHWGYLSRCGLRTQRFHRFHNDPPWEHRRDPMWLRAYRSELERAVAFSAETLGSLGVEVSGGLDSSSVLALAAKSRPEVGRGIHGFGYATLELESRLILATSAMWGIEANHVFTRWDNGGPIELARRQQMFSAAVGHPCQHGNVLGHYAILAQAKRVGVKVLLSGFGGDEGVTNHGFAVLDEFAQRGNWPALMRNYPSRLPTRPLRVAQFSRIRERGMPRPDGAGSRRQDEWRTIFTPEVTAALETLHPELRRAEVAASEHEERTVNGDVLRDLSSPWRDVRLEQSAVFAAAFGVEYRWPLLDAMLVQQYLSTPSVWKMADGQGRYLHRSAMASLLPTELLNLASKNMGRRLLDPSLDRRESRPQGRPTVSAADLEVVGDVFSKSGAAFVEGMSGRARSRVGTLGTWLGQKRAGLDGQGR